MLVPFVSVRLLVAFHQCLFYVGSPVENLAAYLCVRQGLSCKRRKLSNKLIDNMIINSYLSIR